MRSLRYLPVWRRDKPHIIPIENAGRRTSCCGNNIISENRSTVLLQYYFVRLHGGGGGVDTVLNANHL